MPRSNEGEAGLPNPCPIGPQSHCSILLGSPPLGLHRATALHQTHAQRDPCLWGCARSTHYRDNRPSVVPASSSWTHNMPGYPPLGCAPGSTTTRIPVTIHAGASPTALQDTRPPPPHYTSGPAEPQATCGMTGHLPLGLPPIRSCRAPALCGMTGAPPNWDRHQPGVRQLHPPVHQEPCPSGRASPSSTVFPHNHSTRLPLRPPLEGSKHA
jgi:hypothetical protein